MAEDPISWADALEAISAHFAGLTVERQDQVRCTLFHDDLPAQAPPWLSCQPMGDRNRETGSDDQESRDRDQDRSDGREIEAEHGLDLQGMDGSWIQGGPHDCFP